ncbi:hypothetical protein K0M31_014189 [Melipona bicolor]|uniref:Uncharacterized protein n=1 Tax=Melipona bicolor TaxID=60889 RepID=A0AA40G825_9HYME|nr:hypothetical protein K0M31_014189 [Melipona bicolor]
MKFRRERRYNELDRVEQIFDGQRSRSPRELEPLDRGLKKQLRTAETATETAGQGGGGGGRGGEHEQQANTGKKKKAKKKKKKRKKRRRKAHQVPQRSNQEISRRAEVSSQSDDETREEGEPDGPGRNTYSPRDRIDEILSSGLGPGPRPGSCRGFTRGSVDEKVKGQRVEHRGNRTRNGVETAWQ